MSSYPPAGAAIRYPLPVGVDRSSADWAATGLYGMFDGGTALRGIDPERVGFEADEGCPPAKR